MNRLAPSRRLAVIAALTASTLPAAADGPTPTNARCPVMPDKKAVPQFHAEHDGRTVYLCCDLCVQKFRSDPGRYAAARPPPPTARTEAPSTAGRPAAPARPPAWDWFDVLYAVADAADWCERRRPELLAALGVILTAIGLTAVRRRLTRGGRPPGRLARLCGFLGRPSSVAVVLLAALSARLAVELRSAQAAALVVPTPAAPPPPSTGPSAELLGWAWPQGLARLPAGVTATYYRGNDERSDQLFNGGHYRTATFHLSLRGEDGSPVEPGRDVGGRKLALKLELVRAPGTADHFYAPDAMARNLLHRVYGGASEPVLLRVVEVGRRWSADCPVGPVPATGFARQKAVWLFASGTSQPPKPETSTPHYYVQCVLDFQDGKLLPSSVVWMAPVLLSPLLDGPRADADWFSDRPIPEITGENTKDPKLLGLPDGTPGKPGGAVAD